MFQKIVLVAVLLVALFSLGLFCYWGNNRLLSYNFELSPINRLPVAKVAPDQPIDILIIGDLFLDRHIRQSMTKNGLDYPLEKLKDFLTGHDLVIANLEGPVTNNNSVSLKAPIGTSANTIFTFAPETLPMLKSFGLTTFNLANNHTLNFGAAGLASTKKYLAENSLRYFGDPQNQKDLSVVETIRGKKIGLVGYEGILKEDDQTILAEIKKLRPQVDYLIIYPHWGTEYQESFNQHQQKLGHQFIDAGADLVIGSHPHVIQSLEIYKNKVIFYSLGNFLFDQTFSAETSQGLGVKLVLDKAGVSFNLYPMTTVNFQPQVLDGAKRQAVLDTLAKNSTASDSFKIMIQQGIIKYGN